MKKPNKKKVISKGKKDGRPSKFDVKYIKELQTFFDIEPWTESVNAKGQVIRVPTRMPHISRFAQKIGVNRSTVYEWSDESSPNFNKNFSDTLKGIVKQFKEDWLISNATADLIPQPIAIFLLKAHCGLSDGAQKVELTGANGGTIKSETIITIAGKSEIE